tara:strand:- start:3806 stop:4033 length:228 start_codon:yes stop_codon:yes gene_type:complete
MIKSKETKSKGIEIDLTGPDGNAYVIMGYAKRFGKQIGMSDSYIKEMLEKMMSSDYENLIKVFDDEFGSVVTLYR